MRALLLLSLFALGGFALVACPNTTPPTETLSESGSETPTERTKDGSTLADKAPDVTPDKATPREPGAEQGTPETNTESVSDGNADSATPDNTGGIPRLQSPVISVPITTPDKVQIQPSLAMGSSGTLAMTYTAAEGDKKLGIFFVTIGADGKATGPHVRLDTLTGANKTESSLCGLKAGGYVAAWSMDTGAAQDNLQVRFRIVDAAGKPVGTESTIVKTDKVGNHWLARITCLDSGGFAVTGVYPDDGTSFGSFVQRFDATGQPDGKAVFLNTETEGNQAYPVVAAATDGTLAVTWQQGLDAVQAAFRIVPPSGTPGDVKLVPAPATNKVESRPSIAMIPATGEILLAARPQSGPYNLFLYDKKGENPKKLAFPDTSSTNFAPPLMRALGPQGPIALVYMKGPNDNSGSPTVAIVGPSGTLQKAFVITTGRIPLPYRPGLAYNAATRTLWVAYTERTEVTGGLTVKLARFQ